MKQKKEISAAKSNILLEMAIVKLLESSAYQMVVSGNLVYSIILQLLRVDHEYCTIPIGKHLGYYWSPDAAACTGSDYTQWKTLQ